MPRTVPMVASLLDDLAGKAKPGRLYVVLWAYEFGDGFVEVPDPARLALEAGYTTNRAERTFSERMTILREFGFIRSSPLGTREFGHVLLIDPHRAVAALRQSRPSDISRAWSSAFDARCISIGIPSSTTTEEAQTGEHDEPQ
jgi:hypothetical protein